MSISQGKFKLVRQTSRKMGKKTKKLKVKTSLTTASGGDKVSILTKELEEVSMSESALYRVESVEGKGIGCIAVQDVKKGSIVLRESPQLLTQFCYGKITITQENLQLTKVIIKGFMAMSREDQEEYMKLCNKYDEDITKWSERMRLEHQSVVQAANNMTLEGISKEKATKVWAIFDTNHFPNGVCLKMSRFNHSCRPNAQRFWNEDTDTRDLRALRKIKQGEEITLSYSVNLGIESRERRRSELKEDFNFNCNCKACDLTEEEIKEETKVIEEFNEKWKRHEDFKKAASLASVTAQPLLKQEAECLKKMYQLAKEIKTMDRRTFLNEIVEEAFDISCHGAASSRFSNSMGNVEEAWMKDANMFANIGLVIAKTLFGEDHSMTKEWKARSDDPIKFYLKENQVI